MTMHQLLALRQWHLRHSRQHPVETQIWEGVLMLWVAGWVGGPAALLLGMVWAWATSLALLFLPNAYVGLRDRMHRTGRLRCDWIAVVR